MPPSRREETNERERKAWIGEVGIWCSEVPPEHRAMLVDKILASLAASRAAGVEDGLNLAAVIAENEPYHPYDFYNAMTEKEDIAIDQGKYIRDAIYRKLSLASAPPQQGVGETHTADAEACPLCKKPREFPMTTDPLPEPRESERK